MLATRVLALWSIVMTMVLCSGVDSPAGHGASSNSAPPEYWESYVNLNAPVALTCTTAIRDAIVLIGGVSQCCGVLPPRSPPAPASQQVVSMNLGFNANWDLVGDMPLGLRGATTCTSFKDQIVVTGAAQDNNAFFPATNNVTVLDPFTLAPVSSSQFRFPRQRAAFAATADYMYVLGGVNDRGQPVYEVERSNGTTWETVYVSTEPLCDCAVVVHDRVIHLVCTNCDTTGRGWVGTRYAFLSYSILNNTLSTVIDWPQGYGSGPLLSITGTAIAQFAVFIAVYLGSTAPVVYLWDLYLSQLHVMTTADLAAPRFIGSAFAVLDSVYYVGGQAFSAPNVTLTELTPNVDRLSIVSTLNARFYGRVNTTFFVNETVPVQCNVGLRLRIAQSMDCQAAAPGTEDEYCRGIEAPLFMRVAEPLPIAFFCVSPGTCPVPIGARRPCGGPDETFQSCNRELGCCFDSIRNECFLHTPPAKDEKMYFQTASLTTFTVVRPSPSPSPTNSLQLDRTVPR